MSVYVEACRKTAMEYFESGYNCAQSVAMTFCDLCELTKPVISKLACSFGGGMGRLREVCGAACGMFLVAGLLYGYPDTGEGGKKAEHYALIQELAVKFKAQNGSYVCRELLGNAAKDTSPLPEARTPQYYKKRPCKELVGYAAGILAEYIESHPITAF